MRREEERLKTGLSLSFSPVKRERKASTVTVSERELNSDPSSVVVHTRCRSFGFSFSHPWGPTTSWGCSVGETHARGSKR